MKILLALILTISFGLVSAQVVDSVAVQSPIKSIGDSTQTELKIIKYYQVGEKKSFEKTKETKKKEKKSDDQDQIRTLSSRSGHKGHNGGFGAIGVKVSSFKDKTLVMTGIRTGWIINRRLGIGIDGYGIIPGITYVKHDRYGYDDDMTLVGGTAGMFLEPVFFSNQLIHITFPVSSGIGWLGLGSGSFNELYVDERYKESDLFWYLEPGVNLEINMTRNFRLALGVSKRFTQDYDLNLTEKDDFDQLSYYLTLKVGRF